MTKEGSLCAREQETGSEYGANGGKKWAGKWKQTSERASEWVWEREGKRIFTTSKSFLFNEISTCGKCSSCIWFSMSIFSLSLVLQCKFFLLLIFFLSRYRKRYWKWTNRNKNNDLQKEHGVDGRETHRNWTQTIISANRILSLRNWAKLLNPTDKLNENLWCVSVFSVGDWSWRVRKLAGVGELTKVRVNDEYNERDDEA